MSSLSLSLFTNENFIYQLKVNITDTAGKVRSTEAANPFFHHRWHLQQTAGFCYLFQMILIYMWLCSPHNQVTVTNTER